MTHGRLARMRAGAGARWRALKHRRRWVRHVVAAWQLLQRNNGNLYAGAITFFSFLALFPLLLLAVSVVGFVLHSDPGLQDRLFRAVSRNIPGQFGDTIRTSLRTAIDHRSGVGIVGLAGVLLTGLGWVGNVRAAIEAVWGRPPRSVGFLKGRLANLLVLAGLGVGSVLSIGLTVVGTSLTDQFVRALSLDGVPGSAVAVKLLGIALAIAGDMIIFWWLLVRLPAVPVPAWVAWRGALLASVGFEVLKIVGTYTIAHTAHSPTAGPFAGVVAVLVWIQLVARFMLFACAWTATLSAETDTVFANQVPIEEPAAMGAAAGSEGPGDTAPEVSPVAVGAGLIGAGAVLGVAATLAVTRRGNVNRG